MTTQDIILSLEKLTPQERIEIRAALNELLEKDKEAYLAEGEKLYGKKRRSRRNGDEHAEPQEN
jgi:hypothetical protein